MGSNSGPLPDDVEPCGGALPAGAAPVGAATVKFRRLNEALRPQVEKLLVQFLREDEHYLASSAVYGDIDGDGVGNALRLILAHPDRGFVWVGEGPEGPIAACIVCFAVSTSTGAFVAKLDDVYVVPEARGKDTGSQLLRSLAAELCGMGITRIDTSVHFNNSRAKRFYERLGFRTLNEERMSLLLDDEYKAAP